MTTPPDWLQIHRGDVPLIVSFPLTGTELPDALAAQFLSPWLARRDTWFAPYHDALAAEIARLRALHGTLVVYDAHSIRSHIPHLFDGQLPQFNLGTNGDTTCDNALTDVVDNLCAMSGMSHVRNGRFKGGYITRHYSDIPGGVHTLQMELACRGYMHEPEAVDEHSWPTPLDPDHAAPLRATLQQVLDACLDFATSRSAA